MYLIGWTHLALISNHTFYIVLYLHVFPGSLTLREVRAALRSARDDWMSLGVALDLSYRTLEVIEGIQFPSTLYGFMQLVTITLFTIYTVQRVLQHVPY